MRQSGPLRRWLGSMVALVVLAPVLVLVAAAFTDRGPGGMPRVAVFPVAPTLYDPLVWQSLRTSVLVAGIVALIARGLGVPLAWIVARWRFWGRGPLAALGCAPAVVPSLFGALGLRLLLGEENLVPWAPTRFPIREFWNASIGGVWLAYIWAEVAVLTPLVILAATRALERIDPFWEEAGLVVGAGRKALWGDLIWPLIRPEVHRATAWVFGLALLDAGTPMALGLVRTLPGQIVAATVTPDGAARASLLLSFGLFLVVLARRLAVRSPRRDAGRNVRSARPRSASWRRAIVQAFVLVGWCVVAWTPTLALLFQPWMSSGPLLSSSGGSRGLEWLRGLDRSGLEALESSLLAGGLVAVLGLGLAWLLSARPRSGPLGWTLRRMLALGAATPPLAIGVGILLTASVLRLLADFVPRSSWAYPIAFGLRGLGGLLDPYQSPAVGLVVGLVLVRLPLLVLQAREARRRCPPVLLEAAQVSGASRRRAWWDVARPLLGPSLARAALLAAALAAADVSLALVLTPLSTFQTLGPTVLRRFDQPGGLAPAAMLALLATGVNVVAFLLTLRDDLPLDGRTRDER